MRIIDPIIAELEQESQTTKRVLDRVPEGKLSWKPHAKSFSLGQLALHVAAIPAAIARLASVDNFEFGPFDRPEPKTRKEILDTFSESLAGAKQSLNQMDDGRVMSTWNGTRNGKVVLSMPRIGVLRAIMLNHLYHHRGQLVIYLRLLDVPLPSVYGPTADENPF
jgi:uncharacterized damage-inducible protein DinB